MLNTYQKKCLTIVCLFFNKTNWFKFKKTLLADAEDEVPEIMLTGPIQVI